MKNLSRPRQLLLLGLVLLLVGSLLQIRFPLWTSQYTFEISASGSIDIPVSLLYGESLEIRVSFNESADPEDCWVWALVNYQYPTKGISETALRFEGQREVDFTFGWEDVRLIPVFVTGFVLRLFYYGTNTVAVDVIITSLTNMIVATGVGLLSISATMVLIPIFVNRFEAYQPKMKKQ
ncbi:MAG: hypothetical protein OEV85_08490 [Candidatus Thorarchaeota archaeon]|nr:hypothetical protein [Candidatus Thorarchaeota archaeon]